MPAAARVGDNHTCLAANPNGDPHKGGPILAGAPTTVIIGKKPAATIGNPCTCVGPPDAIKSGSGSVFINKRKAARQFDQTVHGGIVSSGFATVIIGD
jgi:uncharacterized Zn-binding protein involved in type VI secretion